MFSSQRYRIDRETEPGKRDRDIDASLRPHRNWIEPDLILIVGAMAAVMALLVFTLHSYSPRLTAVPQISTSEPITTTGQGR